MSLRRLWVLVSFLGCVSVPVNDEISDTVQIKITNTRTPEVHEPLFRIISDRRGQIWAGRVASSSIKRVEQEREKFVRGECYRVTVRLVSGGREGSYPEFCWHGERYIDITLNSIGITSTAWSHN